MLVLAGLIGLSVAVYSTVTMDRARERFGYYPLLHVLLMGVCGAFLAGDLFNLYVWFEVMLMASFVLMALGGERAQMEGAIKYVTINLIASALFLAAVGMLYGVLGTLNMADLAQKLRDAPRLDLLTAIAMLFLVAFGIKAAVFPFFFWLPASYHTPPVAVSAIFAGLLTKVGVYALIRVFTLLVRSGRGLHAHDHSGAVGTDDGHRGSRRRGAERISPRPVVSHHQPDRLHDSGSGVVYDGGHRPDRSFTSFTTSSLRQTSFL